MAQTAAKVMPTSGRVFPGCIVGAEISGQPAGLSISLYAETRTAAPGYCELILTVPLPLGPRKKPAPIV